MSMRDGTNQKAEIRAATFALNELLRMTIEFRYVSGTKITTVSSETAQTDFVNMKNKAEGARRYGCKLSVIRYENPEGQVAFTPEYQTTLNGSRYQSSKRGGWFATEADALVAGRKTVAGALKRYAKLSLDPSSRIVQVDDEEPSSSKYVASAYSFDRD